MKIYLVGGAVRDKLLGLNVSERDFVVVGSSEKEMLALGYQKVGKDFPVFLHPSTHEEYALARTERKVSEGYYGFKCFFSSDTTLEEDLYRRDLTINAIAESEQGDIIDPFNGLVDLKNKVLRHVSDAFIEDPVRILRVARFQAKFPEFKLAQETRELLKNMVKDPDYLTLSKERVYAELKKSLLTPAPWKFIELLDEIGGLGLILTDANISTIKENLKKCLHLSTMHKFFALIYKQDSKTLNSLNRLSLSKIEKYLIKCQSYTLDVKAELQDWYMAIKKMDAIRKRESALYIFEASDTINKTQNAKILFNILKDWDEIIFPKELSDANSIRNFYDTKLMQIIEKNLHQ